ncbi:MAG: hypothetical protein M1286_04290 [Candidatus Marsarchaeota archaeon]|nr:hypothetical protein [Candidatus Marsarchaeota archaeon]
MAELRIGKNVFIRTRYWSSGDRFGDIATIGSVLVGTATIIEMGAAATLFAVRRFAEGNILSGSAEATVGGGALLVGAMLTDCLFETNIRSTLRDVKDSLKKALKPRI